MDLRPFNVKNHRVKHAVLSVATTGSTSISAPGTGNIIVPVYFWALSSGVASLAILNGTTGTVFLAPKTTAGVIVDAPYWEESYLTNKPLVLESTLNGGGTLDFHVWYVVRRTGAGESGTSL